MSSPQDPITPTRFDAPEPAAPADAQAAAAAAPVERPTWVVPGLAALAVLAVLVVFVLPSLVAPPEPGTIDVAEQASGSSTSGQVNKPTADAEAPEEASPWQDAQAAKLRKEAQDVLQALLEIQFELEERGVDQWAAEAFAAATALAQQGDAQYKEREFVAAKESYEQALAGLEALQLALPDAVDSEIARATEALEQVDAGTLAEALALLDVMEPENAALPGLREREGKLPQMATLLEDAALAEAEGDLALAEQDLKEATTLDPAHQRAAAELARVTEAHLEQRFNRAMSEGYAALDNGELSRARQQFQAADKLRPGSGEARAALTEVAAASTASRLGSLQRKGQQQESGEDWQQAVASYEAALKLDPNVLYAVEGLARARARAALDAALSKVLDKPERLADIAVAKDSEALLERARGVQPRGAKLNAQISELEQLLAKANEPITVMLRSDAETEVIVYKVARLGRFEQKSLSLRPGTYTALGTRNGYRDVRRSFTLSHDSAPPDVMITCTEQI